MMRIERANSHHAVNWWSLIGLVLVPVLVALGFLGTTWGRDARLGDIKAAVVNLDQAVTLEGKTVPLGRQLAAAMIERDDANITWVLSDATDSVAGLESGKYAAIVTIPENFSASATSYAGNDAGAVQATIDVRTGENAGIADADIAAEIAALATDTINATLTQAYLDNIYVGFNTVGEQFTTITNGAQQLADGATALSDGVTQASDGTAKLGVGLGRLDTAGRQLDAGGTQLVEASGELTSGAAKLSDGLDQLTSGLTSSTPDWSSLSKLGAGASGVGDGAAGLSAGLDQVQAVLKAYAAGTSTIGTPSVTTPSVPADALTQVQQAFVAQCTPGLTAQFTAGLTQGLTQALTPTLGDAAGAMAAGLASELAGPMASQTCAGTAPAVSGSFEAGFGQGFQAGLGGGFAGGVQAGATVGVRALTTTDPSTGESVVSGSAALADGAGQLASGVDQLATQLPKQTAAQTATLTDALTQLSAGASALSDGIGKYADGVTTFAQGSDAYTTGVHEASTGTSSLVSGMSKLDDGASTLADGASTFASKLADGASEVPSFSTRTRENLASVVARPVDGDAQVAASPLVASTALLTVLALWLGSLITFLVVRPIPSRVLTSSRPSWQLVGAALTPPLAIAGVQAFALAGVAALALHLPAGDWARLLALLLLAGVAFVLVNHALAAWLHGLGRTISVVLATVAAATGLISAVPTVFDWINAVSPIAPALRGIRAIVAGGSGGGGAVAMLLVWVLLGSSASFLAVARKRQLSPKQYRKQVAVAAE